jgi:hypothetical protein
MDRGVRRLNGAGSRGYWLQVVPNDDEPSYDQLSYDNSNHDDESYGQAA